MKLKPVSEHLNSSTEFVLRQWPSILSQLCKPLLWKFAFSISQKAKTMNVFCFSQITKELCMLKSLDFIPGIKSKKENSKHWDVYPISSCIITGFPWISVIDGPVSPSLQYHLHKVFRQNYGSWLCPDSVFAMKLYIVKHNKASANILK